MAEPSSTSDQAMRRFKKRTKPEHIQPHNVMPCGVFGQPGVTLNHLPGKSNFGLVENITTH